MTPSPPLPAPPTPNNSPASPRPRASLAAQSNVSDSACFQSGADALSIIIRGFAESWGLGTAPRVRKSFHEESLELPSEETMVDVEILRNARMPPCLQEGGREGGKGKGGPILFSFCKNKATMASQMHKPGAERKQSQGNLAL